MTDCCADCRFFKAAVQPNPTGGNCKRYPPMLVWMPAHDPTQYGAAGDWNQERPWVAADDWCGEFQRDPDFEEVGR